MLKAAPSVLLYNQDLRAELAALAHYVALERLLEAFDMLQQLSRYLSMNLNSQLLLEQLLVQLPHTLTRSRQPATPPTAGKYKRQRNA
jgi:hypothetical protein